MFKYFFKKGTLPKRRGALVPGRLQNPCLHFFCLPFSKAAALSLAHSPGSVSQDRDPLCTALMIVVIQAVQNVAVHLQPGFRRLKQVFEQASAVFLKLPQQVSQLSLALTPSTRIPCLQQHFSELWTQLATVHSSLVIAYTSFSVFKGSIRRFPASIPLPVVYLFDPHLQPFQPLQEHGAVLMVG